MPKLSAALVLKQAKTPAFLVSNLTNIRYLTGLSVSAGFVLIKGKKVTLYVDGRYEESAKKSTKRGVRVRAIDALKEDLEHTKKCGYEAEDVTVARLSKWKRKFKNTKFVQTVGVIEVFRRVKTREEIKKFRKAQAITKKIMRTIPSLLTPGITEREVAEHIRRLAVDLGADELSFEPIVAFGSNSSKPHHHPSNKTLKTRDIIQIDCGARVHGYCADQSAVLFKGKPTKKQQDVYRVVEEAKRKATKALKPGVTNRKLDTIARDTLKKHNLEQYFIHSLGHGVGLDIHEEPLLSAQAKRTRLKKNEIVTIEPGVYLPGEFGIRLEDEVIVSP